MTERRSVVRWFESLLGRTVRNVLPRTPDFGPLLAEQTAIGVDVLTELVAYCETGDQALADRVSELEKEGDVLRERNSRTLRESFSVGFDRDLTATAIQRIDDVANYGKTTVREMEALNLEPDEHIRVIARELLAGARELHRAALHLGDDPAVVEAHVRAVHKHERNVEKLYRAAVASLFPTEPDALLEAPPGQELRSAIGRVLNAMRQREIYRHLSNAADRLDGAGRILGQIAVTAV
jgi:uncharacterized protein Yka (UPF0111/DUF47 family)